MSLTDDFYDAFFGAADELSKQVDDTLRPRAEAAIDLMDPALVREAAVRQLIEAARAMWRADNLIRERAATGLGQGGSLARPTAGGLLSRAAAPDLYLGKYKHGSTNQRTGAIPRGCDCKTCNEVWEMERAHRERFENNIADLVRGFEKELRMEWTTELLSTGIAMPDGSTTTWGAATIDQHETRFAMLKANAQANAEAAARHLKAIDALRGAGVATLNELVPNAVPKEPRL